MGPALVRVVDQAFAFMKERITAKQRITEYDVQQHMASLFQKNGLMSNEAPNCSVNANSGNPHYEPTKDVNSELHEGDFVLIDLWAKKDKPRSVYADITWMGFLGDTVPDEFEKIFQIVKGGRTAALEFVRSSIKAGSIVHGYEVDDAARNFITRHGYGEYFVHRTGHSIGEEVHGNGANMDNFETHDERRVMPWTCFSIEPGIYLPAFGVRSEINMFVGDSDARVTGNIQREMVLL